MQNIVIRGASENNLKQIDVDIPLQQLTVITGLSGSGKSSLVRDVLQREGQRMYLETFSAYTRSRLGKIRPAKVISIQGLRPVISVGQTNVQANRRSTAGTFSEVSPLLRQLFSRYNDQHEALMRNQFSFNSEKGWCSHCKGLGIEEYIDVEKIVGDSSKSLRDGALSITLPNGYTIYSQVTIDELDKVCKSEGFSVDIPWNALTEHQKNVVLYGSQKVMVLYGKHSLESRMKWTGLTARPRDEAYYRGIIPVMKEILLRDRNDNILRFVSSRTCPVCNGDRLNLHSLGVTWKGKTFSQYNSLPFSQLLSELRKVSFDIKGEEKLTEAIIQRLEQLCKLSVGHISASRLSETLSQGELRRMRLAQLNHSGLTGVLYLFDEPSIGLHPRDVAALIESMYLLVEKGNTVVVVEHNEQVIKAAQYIIELGPNAGDNGGELVFSGTLEQLLKRDTNTSKALKFLTKPDNKEVENESFKTFDVAIEQANNIDNQKFTFAFGKLNAIIGVSGAGKSTLVNFGLLRCGQFKRVVHVDQQSIGRTSRSNPATYTGLFDQLRKLFAQTPDAKKAGFSTSYFSFNSKQGQCPACSGSGVVVTGMHIFEDLEQPCPVCHGTRFKGEVLSVEYKGKNIHQVLQMSVDEARYFFVDEASVLPYLNALWLLGLGYLKLGQPSTTLSGGEAQRIKLASELYANPKQKTLYILDEPTSGLHPVDISKLVSALSGFTEKGHTVVVVEHDVQVILNSDWIVDVGPEGGINGGKCLFCGPLHNFLTKHQSVTTNEILNNRQYQRKLTNVVEPSICLKGIHTHNLKNININIKAGETVAFTGMSGSGKTSLLMHTLHAEGQRLFTENLTSFRRLQLKLQHAADVDEVQSMMPTVAVEADVLHPDIRSTLASVSGIYDLLRLIYSRFADNKGDGELTAADFSLANEYAVCPACEGIGYQKMCKAETLIVNPDQPLLKGALINHKTVDYYTSEQNKFLSLLLAMAKEKEIDMELTWNELTNDRQSWVMFGTGEKQYNAVWEFKRKNNVGKHVFTDIWKGLCRYVEEEYTTHYPSARGKSAQELLSDSLCPVCNGNRLNPEMLIYTFAGRNIAQMQDLTVKGLLGLLQVSQFQKISEALLKQLSAKLIFLNDAGLSNILLNRPAQWLSTGELKWVRLSSILASDLSGLCIILDEPSAGLDSKARKHLVKILDAVKQRGNTILFSDYRPELIFSADRVIELGPKSGINGGNIICDVLPAAIKQSNAPVASEILNLKQLITADFGTPVGRNILDFIKSTQVYSSSVNRIIGSMGIGKSKLLKDIERDCIGVSDYELIVTNKKLPQGNGGSNIATRIGFILDIKKTFASTPQAIADGLKDADFGFNSVKSQCSYCKGKGLVTTSLDFLPDVVEVCPECNGKRYKPEILNYRVEGLSIDQWLGLTVEEALKKDIWSEKSRKALNWLSKAGLDYLTIGQEIGTFSQGELRRLALAEKLILLKKKAIILLDNPTLGLDPINQQKLFSLLNFLAEKGNTVVVAESE